MAMKARRFMRLTVPPSRVRGNDGRRSTKLVLSPGANNVAMVRWYEWLVISLAVIAAVWAVCVALLVLAGRRTEARAFARFIPDCVILFRRLLADPRVPSGRKAVLAVAIGYLALPFDLVPDFIPIAGQLDDAIVVALALRYVLRSGGPQLLAEHWPGPRESLTLILSLAFGQR
jgi:uncharacterized membrane protein YkvA (DUF1232 family)